MAPLAAMSHDDRDPPRIVRQLDRPSLATAEFTNREPNRTHPPVHQSVKQSKAHAFRSFVTSDRYQVAENRGSASERHHQPIETRTLPRRCPSPNQYDRLTIAVWSAKNGMPTLAQLGEHTAFDCNDPVSIL